MDAPVRSKTFRVAADVGGTFTDVVAFDEATGMSYFGKTLTTPRRLVEGIVDGVHKAGTSLEASRLLLHGTTVAINTLLERTGARTALLTTCGFRDIYEIGRINRPQAYNLFFNKHRPLIPRSLRFEVHERVSARGEVLIALDEAELHPIAARLRELDIDAVAILFLHSYANPVHELRAKKIFEALCPGVFVSASHELSQEYREYERTSTVAANAYIGPRVDGYLGELAEHLTAERFTGSFFVVQSSGGLFDVERARRECVRMLESGPAAGVIGARAVCYRLGMTNAIAFDMGGTTAKAGVVLNGAVVMAGSVMVGGYEEGLPIQIPLIDTHEVGTGGGSIARIEPGAGLRVGPQSAGASPGPVCYDLGGIEPTVTDANLVLGRLSPTGFLGGEMRLDVQKAAQALQQRVADPLTLSLTDAANGILRIAATSMAHVVTRVTTERGLDAGDFAMVAYGGAGPLHASIIARELRIPTVIVPPAPGHFSAYGMLIADLRRDFVRTWFRPVRGLVFDDLEGHYAEMESDGIAALARDVADRTRLACVRAADMRYVGQEHAVKVELPAALFAVREHAMLKQLFDAVHLSHYGFNAPAEPAEIVSLHSSVIGTLEKPRAGTLARTNRSAEVLRRTAVTRPVFFAEAGGFVGTPVFPRADLLAGDHIIGPALVEEHASTTVLLPGDSLEVSEHGDLIIFIDRS